MEAQQILEHAELINQLPEKAELIIRKGEALPLQEPIQITKKGNIKAVSTYIAARKVYNEKQGLQALTTDRAIISVNEEKGVIQLDTDPENVFGVVVIGKLEEATDLLPFAVNDCNRKLDRETVVRLLRMNKHLFPRLESFLQCVEAFKKFNAKATVDLQNGSDNRGNRSNQFDKTVTTELPTDFILSAPLYKGFGKETIRIEIAFDLSDTGAKFWFESTELVELKHNRKEQILADEIAKCEGFLVIHE